MGIEDVQIDCCKGTHGISPLPEDDGCYGYPGTCDTDYCVVISEDGALVCPRITNGEEVIAQVSNIFFIRLEDIFQPPQPK